MKMKLLTQIFLAFVLAVLFGLFIPGMEKVQPLGDLFLRLIKFVIVPLVFTTLVVGVASTGDVGKLSRMGGKTVAYYLVTTAIAITIGITAGFLFSPGKGLEIEMSEAAVEPSESEGVIQTLLNIIPTNPIQSLVEGNILQIIVFSLFVGIGITVMGEKSRTVYEFFDGFADVMYKITDWIMKIAPIGVFGLIAPIVAQYGADLLMPLIKIIIAVATAVIIHALVVYSTAVKTIGKLNPIAFFKGIMPATMVAFSTTSSSGRCR